MISPKRKVWRPLALVVLVSTILCWSPAQSQTWPLAEDTEVVGEPKIEFARRSDTLMDIARWVSMGHHELRRANPDVDIWGPGEGTRLLVPAQFVLPDAPRDGIVVNRAEKRLYWFHQDPETGQRLVTSYPVGIGKQGRETPTGSARIVTKLDQPAWFPTQGVIDDYAAQGKTLPRVVPPGPDNPLGDHAIVLDMPGFLLHSTNRPDGVGMRVSQGCVRLYPEHIRELVAQVPVGTPVHFVDQPVKLGRRNGALYLEVLPDGDGLMPDREDVLASLAAWQRQSDFGSAWLIDHDAIDALLKAADGMARAVGHKNPVAQLTAQEQDAR